MHREVREMKGREWEGREGRDGGYRLRSVSLVLADSLVAALQRFSCSSRLRDHPLSYPPAFDFNATHLNDAWHASQRGKLVRCHRTGRCCQLAEQC